MTNEKPNAMTTVTIPTSLLEAMKSGLGARFYNNQLDATMSNFYFANRVQRLTAKGQKFTTYTDGENQLIVVGENVNQQHYTGTTMLVG